MAVSEVVVIANVAVVVIYGSGFLPQQLVVLKIMIVFGTHYFPLFLLFFHYSYLIITHYTLQIDPFWSKNNGKNYDNNNEMFSVVVSKFLNDDDDDVQMLGKIYLELLTTICDH